jgi:hypothetical protein
MPAEYIQHGKQMVDIDMRMISNQKKKKGRPNSNTPVRFCQAHKAQ